MNEGERFQKLTYQDFITLAREEGLTKYERIGFPNHYREGIEAHIFEDIEGKLTNLNGELRRVADIGPGCSDLPAMLIEQCRLRGHHLTLLDSAEMLEHLPEAPFISKVATLFPDCEEWIAKHEGKLDAILCYSVLHYAILDVPIFRFFDAALSLLAPGGQLLIGDVPNVSQRRRFFCSEAGERYHKAFMKTDTAPVVEFNRIEHDQIDDAILFGLVNRARAQGFNAYVVPQGTKLPMSNRREDLLILRP